MPLCASSPFSSGYTSMLIFCVEWLCAELELELIQTQMAQKPMPRAEVYAIALRASQNVKKAEVWVGARCAFWWAGRRRVRE